jgi:toxin CcdB
VENLLRARFSVYENADDPTKNTPFLLDVQTDLLGGLNTRVVIPLRNGDPYKHSKSTQDLMPFFIIKGKKLVLDTPRMAAVPTKHLKSEVGNLKDQQHLVIMAIDRLFHGF